MEINKLCKDAHENANKKGFYELEDSILSKINRLNEFTTSEIQAVKNAFTSQRLMLLVGEVSEAQEALRKNDVENFKEELADVAIRLADHCGSLGVDLEIEIKNKMEKNKSRPYKHGKEF